MGQKGKPSQSLDQRRRSPGKNHNLTHYNTDHNDKDTKVAGRLPDPPFMSEVQLDDVGLCIHAPEIRMIIIVLKVINTKL